LSERVDVQTSLIDLIKAHTTEGFAAICHGKSLAASNPERSVYFSDPAVIGRSFVENSNGLFVRADIAWSRRLRTPRGAFEPGLVEFEPSTA
jgi:hypothetical protein